MDDYTTAMGDGAAVNDKPKYWHPRLWNTSKPASEGGHWRPYSAEADPAMKAWLARRKEKGLMAPEAPPPQPYVPLAIVPPVKGLGQGKRANALAQRLAQAKAELDAERAQRRGGAAKPKA